MPYYTENKSKILLHVASQRRVAPFIAEIQSVLCPAEGALPWACSVGASVKSVEILSEDNRLNETLKCNFPQLQCIEGRDWAASNPRPAPALGSCCTHQSLSGCRCPFCWQMRHFAKKHRGIFVSSLQWTDSGMIWFAGFLNVLVKGCCFAPNKSRLGLAFPPCASVRGARQQLRHSKLLSSTSGKARYGQPSIVLLFEALLWVAEAIFFSVFAANMFKFTLFWRQVVNASEVHTWHMSLFTCCPPFVSCSRCSVYHFKCILIYMKLF